MDLIVIRSGRKLLLLLLLQEGVLGDGVEAVITADAAAGGIGSLRTWSRMRWGKSGQLLMKLLLL